MLVPSIGTLDDKVTEVVLLILASIGVKVCRCISLALDIPVNVTKRISCQRILLVTLTGMSKAPPHLLPSVSP